MIANVTEGASNHSYVLGLVALAAWADLELDLLAGLEGSVPRTRDVREVDEHVVTVVPRDEAVALLGVEELDGSDCHFSLASSVRGRPFLWPFGVSGRCRKARRSARQSLSQTLTCRRSGDRPAEILPCFGTPP